jgi:phage terminase small subunit
MRGHLCFNLNEMASKTAQRHEIFAREYVIDLNGSRAAQAAGIAEAGARVWASRALTKPNVQKRIAQLQSARASRLEIKADRVAEELHRLAFANMQDYMRVNADGWPELDLSTLTRDQAAAIQEFSEDATGGTGDGERRQVLRRRFKLADKRGSLELLGRHLGMFQDNVKVTGLEGLAERLSEIRKQNAGS